MATGEPTAATPSRFKAFKFAAAAIAKPPPLPPKDPVYLQRQQNRSLSSLLSPELPPSSPISPSIQYAIRRANSPSPSPFSAAENNHMNHSSASLVLSDAPPAAAPSTTRQSQASKKDKALAFLKFPKRSPRTPPVSSLDDQDDEGISMPWNFQHNIHVDEGYGGLPPTWSTSLSSAGFSDEEIAAIQARRAAGARSPPDLRYLYTDRPNSPAVNASFPFPSSQPPPAATHPHPYASAHPYAAAVFSPPGVPILTNPTPRSTSLPRVIPEPARPPPPVMPSLSLNTAAPPRVPPPKRKPPASPFDDGDDEIGKGHKPNQASMAWSGDSHASSNNNQSSASTSTLSTRPHAEETLIEEVPRENGPEKKSSIWGTKVKKAKSTKDLAAASASTPNLTSSSASGHTRDPSMSSSSHNHNADAGPSSHPPMPISPPGVINWKASASSLAAAGSSLAGGVVSKGSSFASAMKTSAGRGVMRVRGSLKDKQGKRSASNPTTSSENSSSAEAAALGNLKSPTSDEEFGMLDPDGAELGADVEVSRPAVWELYTTRPRAATDASDGTKGKEPMAQARYTTANSSSHSLASSTKSQPQQLYSHSMANLRRQFSKSSGHQPQIPKSKSQSSLQSVRSQRSNGSLRLGHHKQGSVTSLDSIPEASPAPGAVLAMGGMRKGPAAGSSSVNASASGSGSYANAVAGASGSQQASASTSTSSLAPSTSNYSQSSPSNYASYSNSASASYANVSSTSATSTPSASPQKPPRIATAPPRLSLHQHTDSSDLSSWSEALLSGISLTGSEELNLGLGLDFSGFGSSKEKEPMSAPPASVGKAFGQQQMPWHQPQKPSMLGSGTQLPGHSKSQPSLSTLAASSGSAPTPAPTPPRAVGRKPGQPLPSSKPPPRLPAPAPPLIAAASIPGPIGKVKTVAANIDAANGRSRSTAEEPATTRFMPTPPMPFSPSILVSNKPLPTPLPLPVAATTPPPDGLLSPPPTAWKSPPPGGVTSPAGSSIGPDSAQLWNEIEQMMDPGMISAIPGLHLSVALPPGAKEALRSAGITSGFAMNGQSSAQPLPPLPLLSVDTSAQDIEGGPKTVGDLVGMSPKTTESFPPVEQERGRQMRAVEAEEDDEDDEGSDESDYDARDAYDAYVSIRQEEGEEDASQASITRPLRAGRSQSREKPNGRLLSVSRSRERNQDQEQDERDPTFRDSTRSSSSTLTVTAMEASTIVRKVSVARRAGAYVIDKSPGASGSGSAPPSAGGSRERFPARPGVAVESKHPPSPLSSNFGSEESGSGGSASSGSPSQENPTPTTDGGLASPLFYYLDGTQTPSPTPDRMSFGHLAPPQRRLPGMKEEEEDYEVEHGQEAGYPDEATMQAHLAATSPTPSRPTIIISDAPPSSRPLTTAATTPGSTPLSPFQRYRGWLSAVVAPLEEFIDESVDPRDHYLDLNEIAEGESGSVFAGRLNETNATKLRLPPLIKAQDNDEIVHGRAKLVAIKSIAIVPSGSPKLDDLQKELSLMRGMWHENLLGMDAVYVDLVEDSLWVRMELMERSLADIIGLVGDGLMLQDRMIARFASDVLLALDYLSKHYMAHRDVRSDNLLLNKHGVLKLADFSNAVQVTKDDPMRSEIVGVAFWQAPEVRRPPYDVLKVDVWSLGATVWEMAQTEPPFADTQQLADRWPPLSQPELYSPAFHDFLRKCSEPAASRPTSTELLKTSFINNACGRPVIVQLLSQCLAIEKALQDGDAES